MMPNQDITMNYYLDHCQHKVNLPPSHTLLYCLTTSTFFVASLYIFVPSSVRRLPRDNHLHIQWRSAIIIAVVGICIAIYPRLFCEQQILVENNDIRVNIPPYYVYLGILRWHSIFRFTVVQNVKIILHVSMLYLGSFFDTWIRIYQYVRHIQQQESLKSKQLNKCNPFKELSRHIRNVCISFQKVCLQPKLHSIQHCYNNKTVRWIQLRNLLFAPFAEEVMFRSILLPPLLCSGFSSAQSSWMAPLFFGVAHFHHYHTKRKENGGRATYQLFFGLIFQWMYTTLFGAYASHVFVRTGSLWGVCALHSFCNWMGLPDVDLFWRRESMLFLWRYLIGVVYVVGIGMFWLGFSSRWLFPDVAVLPALLPMR